MKNPILACVTTALIACLSIPVHADNTLWEPPFIGSAPTTLYLPDAQATYWRYGWKRKPGDTVGYVFKGKFPHARYFSYNVYNDDSKQSLGSFSDFELETDGGKKNPFAGGKRSDAGYTLYVMPEGTQTTAENVLYYPDNLSNVSILIRHYLPEKNIEGGVPMPDITQFDANTGKVSAAPPSEEAKLSKLDMQKYLIPMFESAVEKFKDNPEAVMAQLKSRSGKASLTLEEIIARQVIAKAFTHYHKGEVIESYRLPTSGTFPNKDNLYLAMPVERDADEVVLVKFKVPPYPKSPEEYSTAPVRYFSLSQGDDITYGFGTTIDKEMIVQADGDAYFIIGDDSQAMRQKATELRANFMPWKAGNKMLLVYRHMLPRVDYPHGINQVRNYDNEKPEKGQEGRAFIGDYAPTGKLYSHEKTLSLTALPTF